MSAKELKVHIRSAGLSFADCIEKTELVARAQEATAALIANAPREGRDLVVALVNHAAKVLNVDMAPFLEAHVDSFDQATDQLQSGHGETFEQYEVFRAFQAQLEKHFDAFVVRHGFGSAQECFAAIDAALAIDKEQQKEQMAEMEAKLKELQQHWMAALQQQHAPETGGNDIGVTAGATEAEPSVPAFVAPIETAEPEPPPLEETDLQREQREIREAQERRRRARQEAIKKISEPPSMTQAADGTVPVASLPSAPLLLFSQPVGLEQMLQHAMSLTEYTTFSTVMRTKAEEVAKRRAWAERAETRRSRSEAIRTNLESPEYTTEGLTAAWGHLRSRTLSLVMPGEDLEDRDQNVVTTEGMPPELIEMIRIEDERFAAMCALLSPPQGDEAKSELLQLLAAPFLRLLGILPNSASRINEKLPKLQELIMSGAQPCRVICAQALLQCHRLLDDAEANMDEAIANANAAAANARATFQASQAEAAQVSRLQALQLGKDETRGGAE